MRSCFALVALALTLPAAAPRGVLLGRSVQGRRVVAAEAGDPSSPRKALVVGCIHGNECAGVAVIRRLRSLGAASGVDLWLVPEANPDGTVADRRWNARSGR